MSDRAPGPSISALIAPPSPDRANLMMLCFPDEIDDHGTFAEISDIVDGVVPCDEYIDEMLTLRLSHIEETVQPRLASSFDLFGVSTIKLAEESLTTPTLEPIEDVIADVDGLLDGPVGLVEGVSDFVDSPLSFDVLSRFVSHPDYASEFSSMYLSVF